MAGDGAPGGLPLICRFLPGCEARNPHPRQLEVALWYRAAKQHDTTMKFPVHALSFLCERNYTVKGAYFLFRGKNRLVRFFLQNKLISVVV